MEVTANQRLKEFRKLQEMSQKDFAASLELGQVAYSDIERGKNTISEPVLLKLITIYKMSPTWLYTGIGEMTLNISNLQGNLNILTDIEKLDGNVVQGDGVIKVGIEEKKASNPLVGLEALAELQQKLIAKEEVIREKDKRIEELQKHNTFLQSLIIK
jgi:transcriptional regulator with XRE-family HTH domain